MGRNGMPVDDFEVVQYCSTGPYKSMSYCKGFVSITNPGGYRMAEISDEGLLIIRNLTESDSGLYWPELYAGELDYAPPQIKIELYVTPAGTSDAAKKGPAPQFFRKTEPNQPARDTIQYDVPQPRKPSPQVPSNTQKQKSQGGSTSLNGPASVDGGNSQSRTFSDILNLNAVQPIIVLQPIILPSFPMFYQNGGNLLLQRQPSVHSDPARAYY